jgi:hypothetical protein
MNLQELLAELLTISYAYPDDVKVRIETVDFKYDINSLMVESFPTGVEVIIRVR